MSHSRAENALEVIRLMAGYLKTSGESAEYMGHMMQVVESICRAALGVTSEPSLKSAEEN